MKERKAVVKSGKPAVASWAAWLCRSMNILISIREKRMNTAVTNAPQYTEVSRAIFFGLPSPFAVSQTEIVADNGLSRLCNGVAYHKGEGYVVTGDSERPYAVLVEVLHEDLIARENESG